MSIIIHPILLDYSFNILLEPALKDEETVLSPVNPYGATDDEKVSTEMEFYDNAVDDTEYIDEELNFAEDVETFLGKCSFMLTVQWLNSVHTKQQVYLFN